MYPEVWRVRLMLWLSSEVERRKDVVVSAEMAVGQEMSNSMIMKESQLSQIIYCVFLKYKSGRMLESQFHSYSRTAG